MRAFISYSVTEKQFGGAVKQAPGNPGVECFPAHDFEPEQLVATANNLLIKNPSTDE